MSFHLSIDTQNCEIHNVWATIYISYFMDLESQNCLFQMEFLGFLVKQNDRVTLSISSYLVFFFLFKNKVFNRIVKAMVFQ